MLEASQSWLPRVKENMSAQDMDDVLQLLLMDFGDETLHTAFTSSSLACTEPPLSADTPATQTSVETHLPITGGVGTGIVKPKPRQYKPRCRKNRKRPKHMIEELRTQVATLQHELKKLKEGDGNRGEAIRMATKYRLPPFNLMEAKLKDGTMPEVPTTSKLWERIALYEKKRERAAKDENAFLRSRTEEQKKVLVHLQDSMHEASRVERQSESTCAQEASSVTTIETLETSDGFESSSSSSDSSTRVPSKSLTNMLDQLHNQVDDVFSSCGILQQNLDMHCGPVCKGSLPLIASSDYVEQIECRVFPLHYNISEQIAWKCLGSAPLHHPNGTFQPQTWDDQCIYATFTDKLRSHHVPVSGHVNIRRYQEKSRTVIVSWAMIEIKGATSLRISGETWVVVRPQVDNSSIADRMSGASGNRSVVLSRATARPYVEGVKGTSSTTRSNLPPMRDILCESLYTLQDLMLYIDSTMLGVIHSTGY